MSRRHENAADTGQVKERKRKDKDAEQQAQDDLREVMDTAAGRRFVWRMLERAGIYRQSFTGNSSTFFNEGERNVGLFLLSELQAACPQAFIQMQQEQLERQQREQQSND